MEIFSPYIIAGLTAWFLAHLIKYVTAAVKAKNARQLERFYLSGGMPSAHAATITAIVLSIGLIDGFGTPVFALGAVMAAIVMYDAVMVRRSSGEQGAALLAYFTEIKSKVTPFRVAKGHTPLEVVAGAILGALVAVLAVWLFSA